MSIWRGDSMFEVIRAISVILFAVLGGIGIPFAIIGLLEWINKK